MSFLSQRDTINGMFQDGWKNPDNSEYLPVQYENKPRPDTDHTITWCRFTIRNAPTLDKTIGGDETRKSGVVYLEIFVRENNGVRPARAAADKFKEIFEHKRVTIAGGGDILFREVSLIPVGSDGGFSKHNAMVSFQHDEAA